MSEDMKIEDYLAQGGKLTSPGNASPRYRAELMRLMAGFVDSELAGAAGFADVINQGPGVKERIAASRIVMEKTDHADKVLRLMGEFGANTDRYANYHPWTDRLDRDAEPGAHRANPDMRLAVFNYPLAGWTDAVVMNLLMGKAVEVQLQDYANSSYQPFAEAVRTIAPVEANHTRLAAEGVEKLKSQGDEAALQESVDYWWPRVALSFGGDASKRLETLRKMGLRTQGNADLRGQWDASVRSVLDGFGMTVPG